MVWMKVVVPSTVPRSTLRSRMRSVVNGNCRPFQFDFNEPERFDMTFVDSDGVEKRPYMIHRALLGSIERFFGVLLEHFAGAFPLWLAPNRSV